VHDAERVVGDDEVGIDLDGAREEVGGLLVGRPAPAFWLMAMVPRAKSSKAFGDFVGSAAFSILRASASVSGT